MNYGKITIKLSMLPCVMFYKSRVSSVQRSNMVWCLNVGFVHIKNFTLFILKPYVYLDIFPLLLSARVINNYIFLYKLKYQKKCVKIDPRVRLFKSLQQPPLPILCQPWRLLETKISYTHNTNIFVILLY